MLIKNAGTRVHNPSATPAAPFTVNGKPAFASVYGPTVYIRWDGAVASKAGTAATITALAAALTSSALTAAGYTIVSRP